MAGGVLLRPAPPTVPIQCALRSGCSAELVPCSESRSVFALYYSATGMMARAHERARGVLTDLGDTQPVSGEHNTPRRGVGGGGSAPMKGHGVAGRRGREVK